MQDSAYVLSIFDSHCLGYFLGDGVVGADPNARQGWKEGLVRYAHVLQPVVQFQGQLAGDRELGEVPPQEDVEAALQNPQLSRRHRLVDVQLHVDVIEPVEAFPERAVKIFNFTFQWTSGSTFFWATFVGVALSDLGKGGNFILYTYQDFNA